VTGLPTQSLPVTATNPLGADSSVSPGDGPPAAPIEPGTLLAGRYRIVELAGQGGMGVVYRAEDLKLDETVALKFLPDEVGRDAGRLSRLLNEVRTARQVSHPNICRVYDAGEAEGRHFLTMEYIEGEDLASLLRRKGKLPGEEALAIARQIGAGVAAAHERGVLHRDLKPSNVMIDGRGVARITDFGLAEATATLRGTKAREGTPSYMAPEALAGGEVTSLSDIYSLGLVLYEIFTGSFAYPGSTTVQDLLEQRRSPPAAPSGLARDIDPSVARLILRCLETEPARRPSSALAVATALPGGASFAAAVAVAQQKADRISAFRAELGDLQRAGVLHLDAPSLAALRKHHEGILTDLVEHFDVDVSERGKTLSLGMKVVSLIGAIALGASAFFFFYRIWGLISLPAQIGILVAVPAIALAATAMIDARDRSGYFTSLAAFFALAGLILNMTVLGNIFSLAGSPMSLLIWGLFAMILAYGYGLRLLLASGVVCLAALVAASIPFAMGGYWAEGFNRMEGFIPSGILVLLLHERASRRSHPEFAPVYRMLGLMLILWPLFVESIEAQAGYLPLAAGNTAIAYEIVSFAVSAGAIWLGLARRWKETVYVGGVSFAIFLYVQFVHWWWDWMPRYLFFLIVAVTAIGGLLILKRLRAVMAAPREGARP
jgi:hypothetical protein